MLNCVINEVYLFRSKPIHCSAVLMNELNKFHLTEGDIPFCD